MCSIILPEFIEFVPTTHLTKSVFLSNYTSVCQFFDYTGSQISSYKLIQ